MSKMVSCVCCCINYVSTAGGGVADTVSCVFTFIRDQAIRVLYVAGGTAVHFRLPARSVATV